MCWGTEQGFLTGSQSATQPHLWPPAHSTHGHRGQGGSCLEGGLEGLTYRPCFLPLSRSFCCRGGGVGEGMPLGVTTLLMQHPPSNPSRVFKVKHSKGTKGCQLRCPRHIYHNQNPPSANPNLAKKKNLLTPLCSNPASQFSSPNISLLGLLSPFSRNACRMLKALPTQQIFLLFLSPPLFFAFTVR